MVTGLDREFTTWKQALASALVHPPEEACVLRARPQPGFWDLLGLVWGRWAPPWVPEEGIP